MTGFTLIGIMLILMGIILFLLGIIMTVETNIPWIGRLPRGYHYKKGTF